MDIEEKLEDEIAPRVSETSKNLPLCALCEEETTEEHDSVGPDAGINT